MCPPGAASLLSPLQPLVHLLVARGTRRTVCSMTLYQSKGFNKKTSVPIFFIFFLSLILAH